MSSDQSVVNEERIFVNAAVYDLISFCTSVLCKYCVLMHFIKGSLC